MLLREDYFKDIELNDDDIKAEDVTYSNLTINDIIRDANLNYRHTIKIILDSECYLNEITDAFLSKTAKRLSYILDLYNIQHSPMYVLSGQHRFHNIEMVSIVQHENYIDAINNEKDDTLDYFTGDNHSAIIYIDTPKFNNIKKMMLFIKGLMNILFVRQLNPIIREIVFYNEIREIFHESLNFEAFGIMFDEYRKIDMAFDIFEKKKVLNQRAKTIVIYFMEHLIRWFFGRKTEEHFEA